MSGVGIFDYLNGDTFLGAYKNNLRNGKGTFNKGTGDIITGEWKDDNLMENFTVYSKKDKYFYPGIINNGNVIFFK